MRCIHGVYPFDIDMRGQESKPPIFVFLSIFVLQPFQHVINYLFHPAICDCSFLPLLQTNQHEILFPQHEILGRTGTFQAVVSAVWFGLAHGLGGLIGGWMFAVRRTNLYVCRLKEWVDKKEKSEMELRVSLPLSLFPSLSNVMSTHLRPTFLSLRCEYPPHISPSLSLPPSFFPSRRGGAP